MPKTGDRKHDIKSFSSRPVARMTRREWICLAALGVSLFAIGYGVGARHAMRVLVICVNVLGRYVYNVTPGVGI